MNEPIYSMLSGKYPNGFVATGIPSSWQFYQAGDPNNLTYVPRQGSWYESFDEIYQFTYQSDWPCNCGDYSTLVSGWFFWSMGPHAFAPGSPGGSPPSGGWQTWNYAESCSNHNISACGGGSQTINLTFTPV